MLQAEVKKALQNEAWRAEYMQNMAFYMDAKREGRAEGSMSKLYALVEEGLLSIEAAANHAGISIEQFKNNMLLTGHKIP